MSKMGQRDGIRVPKRDKARLAVAWSSKPMMVSVRCSWDIGVCVYGPKLDYRRFPLIVNMLTVKTRKHQLYTMQDILYLLGALS